MSAAHKRPATNRTPWLDPALLGCLLGLLGAGGAGAAVVAPALASGFSVSSASGGWVLTAYAMSLAGSTMFAGRLADTYGVRGPLAAGVALMGFGALLGAIAPQFWMLICARVIQGAGSAAVPVLAPVMLQIKYAPLITARSIPRFTAVGVVVGSSGPIVGGLLADGAGWRWAIALPSIGLLLVPVVLLRAPGRTTTRPLSLATPATIGGLVVGVVLLAQASVGNPWLAGVGAATFLASFAALRGRRQATERSALFAIVADGRVPRHAAFAAVTHSANYGLLVILPIWLSSRGWDAAHIGAVLLFGVPAATLGPALARRLVPTWSSRAIATAAVGCASLGLITTLAGVLIRAPAGAMAGIVLINIAFVLAQSALGLTIRESVAPALFGAASGLTSVILFLGGGLGSTLGSVVGIWGTEAALTLLLIITAAALAVGVSRRDSVARDFKRD